MTKNELKYVNSLKEENERVKTLLMRFVDAVGKLTNIDDVVNMSLIPLMTEQNKKFRAEIKAEAYKEFVEEIENINLSNSDDYFEFKRSRFNNLLNELVGDASAEKNK